MKSLEALAICCLLYDCAPNRLRNLVRNLDDSITGEIATIGIFGNDWKRFTLTREYQMNKFMQIARVGR